MSFIQSIILGALQGMSEFLPISSSGHLLILKHLFSLGDVPLLFDILLHVSTLAVVIIAFRKRIGSLFASLFRLLSGKRTDADRENISLIIMIIIVTFFTGIIGYGISKLNIQSPKLVSAFFIASGLILLVPYYLEKRRLGILPGKGKEEGASKEKRELGHGTNPPAAYIQGIVIGIAQGIGALPGISRSGITISAALASGIDRKKAGEFSFIISIPAIIGALILDAGDAGELFTVVPVPVVIAGMLTACAVGAVSLFLLLKLIQGGRLHLFSFYLIPLGIAGLLFL